MTQYPSPYDEEDDESNAEFSSERRQRRFAIDLTANGVRIALTLLTIGLGILVIYFAIRPGGDEGTSADSLSTPPASEEEQPAGGAEPMATFTPGPTSTPPPTDDPTPEPTAEGAAPAPGTLGVGGTAVVTGTGANGLNMRAEGNTGAVILQILQDGTTLTLLEGPVDGEGRQWWRVQSPDGAEGWVVQDFLSPGG